MAHTPLGQPAESIQSGHYGDPPRAWWWLKQSVIYFCGLFGMKVCVLVIFVMLPWISRVGDWALSWTEGNEQLQIVFVMMLFPLIMNALQYYIIDSFIKKQPPKDGARATDAEGGGGVVSYGRLADMADDEASDEDGDGVDVADGDAAAAARKTRPPALALAQETEYDPEIDGDSPTVVGSNSSRRSEAGKLLSAGLFPHE